MTPEFHTATYDDLKPVLDILTTLPDPMPMTDFHWVIERLGWTPQAPRFGHTNLPVNKTLYMAAETSVNERHPSFSSISFRVSDSYTEGDSDKNLAMVRVAFPSVVDTVIACLQSPSTRERPWGDPGLTWDLPQGGQVDLVMNDYSIWLHVKSDRLHRTELTQIKYGFGEEDMP